MTDENVMIALKLNQSHHKNLTIAFNRGWRETDSIDRKDVCRITGNDCDMIDCNYHLQNKLDNDGY